VKLAEVNFLRMACSGREPRERKKYRRTLHLVQFSFITFSRQLNMTFCDFLTDFDPLAIVLMSISTLLSDPH